MEAATRSGRAPDAVEASRAGTPGVADDELVRRVRAGRIDAFATIFDRYRDPLLSFCRHMLGSREDAEDAAQHTFMAAHRALCDTDRPIDLRPWLFAIARNRCLDTLRARRPTDLLEDERAAEASVDGLLDTVQRREDLRALVSDIQSLPVAQRAALVMFELGGLSQAQLSQALECRPAQVKALIYQARASLMADREARRLECRVIREELSTARAHDLLRSHLRRHLRVCAGCRDFSGRVRSQREALALVLPVLPTAGLKATVFAGILGGAGAGTAGAGALGAAALGGGAAAGGGSGAAGVAPAAGSAGPSWAGAGSAIGSAANGGAGAASAGASPVATSATSAMSSSALAGTAGTAGAGLAATSAGGGVTSGLSGLLGKGLLFKALAVAGLFGAVGAGGATVLQPPPGKPMPTPSRRADGHPPGGQSPSPTRSTAPQGAGAGPGARRVGSEGHPGPRTGSSRGSGDRAGSGAGDAFSVQPARARPPAVGPASGTHSSESGSQTGRPPRPGSPAPLHRDRGPESPGRIGPPAPGIPALPLGRPSPTPAGSPRVAPLPSIAAVDKLPLPPLTVGGSRSGGGSRPSSGPGSQGGLPRVSVPLPGAPLTIGA
jgi:RNA polymerase sigma factor (sigma-70 family)